MLVRKKNKNNKFLNRDGQNLLEYTIVVGLVTAVLIAMGTYIQRGAQGMVRTVADQIGVQNKSDQIFNSATGGYIVQADSKVDFSTLKETRDSVGIINYAYDDATSIFVNQVTDTGFLESPTP